MSYSKLSLSHDELSRVSHSENSLKMQTFTVKLIFDDSAIPSLI